MRVRLQKYLAACGVASRRESEKLIMAGRVKVNGEIIAVPGTVIDDKHDLVTYNEQTLKPPRNKTYIMLNKPDGCVTTARDQFGRPTVMDYIKNVDARLVPVGRLDYDTSGLLLLTDDGELVNKLTHPRHNVNKTYSARIKGAPTEAELKQLREGVVIDGRKTAEAEVRLVKSEAGISVLWITIHEGRNRQVRKMCEAAGYRILRLQRIAVGSLMLGGLKKGEYRRLTPGEVEYLYKLGQ